MVFKGNDEFECQRYCDSTLLPVLLNDVKHSRYPSPPPRRVGAGSLINSDSLGPQKPRALQLVRGYFQDSIAESHSPHPLFCLHLTAGLPEKHVALPAERLRLDRPLVLSRVSASLR